MTSSGKGLSAIPFFRFTHITIIFLIPAVLIEVTITTTVILILLIPPHLILALPILHHLIGIPPIVRIDNRHCYLPGASSILMVLVTMLIVIIALVI